MITKIGITAGEIWEYLDLHNREANINEIIEAVKKEREIIFMSIGWLAREGHVVLDGICPDYRVKLT